MGYKKWVCIECGQEVYAKEKPTGFKWKDGHICKFEEVKE